MTARPFVDKNGKPLKPGMRVRFSVATHYVNTCEGVGTVTGFSEYGSVLIESDTPIGIGAMVTYTKKIGVSSDYDSKLRAWRAHHPMFLDGYECSATWVEIMGAGR